MHSEAASAPDIRIGAHGAAGLVTLDRPRARNAITASMRAALAGAFPRFARDPDIYGAIVRSAVPGMFSAGGDLRELWEQGRMQPGAARQALADEYRLVWLLECFSKPTVSLIDGAVMGSGVGITLFGTHRVAGESYAFAMPETAVGFFPDDGVTHFFSRLPHATGMYLGLTGRRIGRADAFQLGLATHCIRADHFKEIEGALADAQPVDPLLDGLHEEPGPSELAAVADVIAAVFSADSVKQIMTRLEQQRGTSRDWAQGVLADLHQRSPLSLKVTHRAIRQAAGLDLRQVLQNDYRLAVRLLEGHDFYEGVRALLIDKDRDPRWDPAGLEQVTPAMVDACFAPLPEGDLALPTRAEMQAARV